MDVDARPPTETAVSIAAVHGRLQRVRIRPVSTVDWSRLRVALAHDYFLVAGGAERVAASLHEMFPTAPVYTSAVRPRGLPESLDRRFIRPTYLQRAPGIGRLYRAYLPFYRRAFESIDLSGYDLVVASSSAWAHRVTLRTRAPVVVYCHNPPRFLWQTGDYLRHEPGLRRTLAAFATARLSRLRASDLAAASAATTYVANSAAVAARIKHVYGRDAEVIPPPIDVDRFAPQPQGDSRWLSLGCSHTNASSSRSRPASASTYRCGSSATAPPVAPSRRRPAPGRPSWDGSRTRRSQT